MGQIPPPRRLSTKEFKETFDKLKKTGKSLTLENIDPVLWKWKKARDFEIKRAVVVGVIVAVITIVAVLFAGCRRRLLMISRRDRFKLLFCKKRIAIDPGLDGDMSAECTFKRMNNKTYILSSKVYKRGTNNA